MLDNLSTKAQAILHEIRALPPQELAVVWRELEPWSNPAVKTDAMDPIRSARGMRVGGRLGETLPASRTEERRRG
jgi:hypothetical protein